MVVIFFRFVAFSLISLMAQEQAWTVSCETQREELLHITGELCKLFNLLGALQILKGRHEIIVVDGKAVKRNVCSSECLVK